MPKTLGSLPIYMRVGSKGSDICVGEIEMTPAVVEARAENVAGFLRAFAAELLNRADEIDAEDRG